MCESRPMCVKLLKAPKTPERPVASKSKAKGSRGFMINAATVVTG